MTIRVVVAGALGNVGHRVIETISRESDIAVVGAVDVRFAGQPLSDHVLSCPRKLVIDSEIADCLAKIRPDVLVDFTNPASVFKNAMTAAEMGVRPVIGTTGLQAEAVQMIARECERQAIGGAMIHNFAPGAVLLARFAQQAASEFGACEIVELHNDRKLDAPSGTALWLKEKVEDVTEDPVVIHSVRRPGLLSQHRLVFGGTGETLILTHDANDVASFLPGIVRAVRWVMVHAQFATELEDLND